ncbi:hypothetical protein LWF15_20725 [Kineosporia rhizophila]|uniref:alpha/beta fold hydrolase n=1 Tax=Kineosporia rhizophila TaxID=84633 RepID=UPI001E3520F4|nr:alpha/beta hydrolase [Kineosporia rhizophila]MCE0537922.1 hypothetical protein [Kineosporia rhizophila]
MATVVIHGDSDPLVGIRGGRATAEAAGAELVVIPGMGHDLPEGAWERIVQAITENAAKGPIVTGQPFKGLATSVAEAFSPEMEAEVSRRVLGDRRHGLEALLPHATEPSDGPGSSTRSPLSAG